MYMYMYICFLLSSTLQLVNNYVTNSLQKCTVHAQCTRIVKPYKKLSLTYMYVTYIYSLVSRYLTVNFLPVLSYIMYG